ncbi:hypothetical protein ABT095_01520 [Kitasatospora sp. NPDC002227]|uniref:hypothetical protein n=1 Tax=Kitasatospora sp. NPDC002227 TaxID=3154773 RepID=UPI00332640E5
MTDIPLPSSNGSPREVLDGLGDLTRRVRAVQRGTWFPLLLLGLLTLGGILVTRLTVSIQDVPCPDGGSGCTIAKQGSPLYWTVGLVLVYAATAAFYLRRSRSRGVGTPVRPYVLIGPGLVFLVSATSFWAVSHLTPGAPVDFLGARLDPHSGLTTFLLRLTGSAASIGLPLLVLAWVERSPALLLLTLVYLAVELVPLTTGWSGIAYSSPWSGLPRYGVPGLLLLLGALGFARAQLPRRRTAS